jgi:DNA-directed RNA polymerase alpha subunit
MDTVFSKHEEGCTPLSLCKNCKIVEFLREKLNADDFANMIKMWTSPSGSSDPTLDRKIEDLHFSARIENCLRNEKIFTVRELANQTEITLLKIPNLGKGSLTQIKDVLASLGLKLKSRS